MDILWMSLAVFFTISFLHTYIKATEWVWQLLPLVLGFAALGLWGDIVAWYGAFAVAGASTLLLRIEGLLIVKSDEALSRLVSRRR